MIETLEFVVELREIEEKDNLMENAMFQIKEAIVCSQKFFKIGALNSFGTAGLKLGPVVPMT